MPPPELFSESPDGKPCNLITRENYEYLRDSFFRYASLMKKEAVHAPGLTMAEGITRLHDEMSDLVGNDMNVNIEQDGERLIFRLWKCHRWGELTLYYFPVKFVENLGPELRRISVTFIHNLMQANGIDTMKVQVLISIWTPLHLCWEAIKKSQMTIISYSTIIRNLQTER